MKTSHSSLLADTGLSEIELDRMGFVPIEREDYDSEMISLVMKGLKNPVILARLSHTFRPFKNKPWYEDEDILNFLEGMGMYTEFGARPGDWRGK